MKIKFYVIHCDSSRYTCFITTRDGGVNSYLLGKQTAKALGDESRVHKINSFGFHFFLNELDCSPTFHHAVARNIKRSSLPFVIQLVPNKEEFIDRTW
jgi:hypothetical protein